MTRTPRVERERVADAPRPLLDALLKGLVRLVLNLRPQKRLRAAYVCIRVYTYMVRVAYAYIRIYEHIRLYEYECIPPRRASQKTSVCPPSPPPTERFDHPPRIFTYIRIYGENIYVFAYMEGIFTYTRIYGGPIYLYTCIWRVNIRVYARDGGLLRLLFYLRPRKGSITRPALNRSRAAYVYIRIYVYLEGIHTYI